MKCDKWLFDSIECN